LEQEIESAEIRFQELIDLMGQSNTYQDNPEQLQQIIEEYNKLEKRIPLAYDEWEQYNKELEES